MNITANAIQDPATGTVASLGTAGPVAVGTTAAVGGACVYVSNIVFEATHP